MPVGRGGHNADYVYIFRNTRMTQISVERKHSLGRDAARAKAEAEALEAARRVRESQVAPQQSPIELPSR